MKQADTCAVPTLYSNETRGATRYLDDLRVVLSSRTNLVALSQRVRFHVPLQALCNRAAAPRIPEHAHILYNAVFVCGYLPRATWAILRVKATSDDDVVQHLFLVGSISQSVNKILSRAAFVFCHELRNRACAVK